MKKKILLLLVLLVVGCGSPNSSTNTSISNVVPEKTFVGTNDEMSESVEQVVSNMAKSVSSPQVQTRIIIQNGDLEVVVPDPEAAVREISHRAVELGAGLLRAIRMNTGTI